MSRFVASLKLVRLPMVFTAMADSAAGVLVGGGTSDLVALGGVMLVSALLYSAGMLLNDLADVERDRGLHPERPLVTGQLSWKGTMAAAGALAVLALLLATAIDPVFDHRSDVSTTHLAVVLLASIVAYDVLTKHWGVIGAVNMGVCRALNLVLGFSIAGDFYVGMPFAIMAFLYILVVTSISLLEERPDRLMYAGLMIALASVPFGLTVVSDNAWLPLAVSGPIVFRGVLSLRSFDLAQIRKTVGMSLRLIIVLDACYVAATGQWIGALLLLPLLAAVWAATRALKVLS